MNTMNIYLIKNGQNAGPYTINEVQSRLNSGAYAENDLAWYEGCGDPISLSEVLRRVVSSTVKTQTTGFSSAELTHLAQNQLFFTITIVLSLVIAFVPLPADFDEIGHSIGVALSFLSLGCGWRLARSLKRRVWLWLLLLLCPVLSWFFAAYLIWLAFKTLKENKAP